MATVTVDPGVCGFQANIMATADEAMNVQIEINSACPLIQKLAIEVAQVPAMDILRHPIHETQVYRAAGAAGCHAACPIPSAIIKAIEVAAGLALPRDVHMIIARK